MHPKNETPGAQACATGGSGLDQRSQQSSPGIRPLQYPAPPDRRRLPDRRNHEVQTFEHQGVTYRASVARFRDGTLAELFLDGGKVGSAVETASRDAAILASLALQFGCPRATMGRALVKLADGSPAGPVGLALALLDAVA
jgi:hypothetical protein